MAPHYFKRHRCAMGVAFFKAPKRRGVRLTVSPLLHKMRLYLL
jgi:hypothetical protein